DWRGMAEAVARCPARPGAVFPELAELIQRVLVPLLDGEEMPRSAETSFAELRNRLAHGGGVTRRVAERLVAVWREPLDRVMSRARWLGDISLVVRRGESGFGRMHGPRRVPQP